MNLRERYLYLLGYRDAVSVGKCFQYGRYVKKDLEQAKKHYIKAALQGNPDAFYQLKILAEQENDIAKAYFYLGKQQACLQHWQSALTAFETSGKFGYADAFYQAGLLFKADHFSTATQTLTKDSNQEIYWYRQAAKSYSKHGLDALLTLSSQIPQAASQLAQMYEQGEMGNIKNLTKAVAYYEQASQMKNANASYRLGQLYEFGEETFLKDSKKAFNYYLIAAQQGDQQALEGLERISKELNNPDQLYRFADIYEKHFNKKLKAIKMFKFLADAGHEKALVRMNSLTQQNAECAYILAQEYENAGNFSQAITYYEKAVKKKHKNAALQLAKFYLDKDDEKSFDYFLKAAQWGHAEALLSLERLAYDLDPDKQLQLFNLYRTMPFNDQHKALYWYQQALQNSSCLQDVTLTEAHIKQLVETNQNTDLQQLSRYLNLRRM